MQFDFNNHLNNEILQQNRLQARSYFIPYENKAANTGNIAGAKNSTRCHSLCGKWNFAYYENIREAFDAGEQTYTDEINVPDVWQFSGYEKPFYINVAYPFPATPPYVPDCAPGAVYNRKFSYKKAKNLSRSIITFQGVSAGFDLFINGKYVGYSQGSHYPSEFDVTDCLSDGENDIKVIVYKWTTGSWFECQDMLRNNGIFREVYITDIIENGVYDVAWTCKKRGNAYDCKVSVEMQTEKPSELCVTLTDKDDRIVFTDRKQVKGESTIGFSVENPLEWNAENPVLYDLSLSVFVGGQEVENMCIPVGFRNFTVENGVFKVNGVPVKCHGVNHHDTTPDRGCALTTDDYEKDFRLMKELNIDTIRFSHYPPCPAALELCDRMGFYVIDETDLETHGAFFMDETFDYFSNSSEYLAEYLDRIARLYARDKNHASIILWSLGNESGFGENQKKMAQLLKSYDKDLLIHYEGAWNWEGENGFDVVSMMYPSCEKMVEMMNNRPNKPFFLCEYAHAMGVGPGGLKDYWTTIYENERSMGGCIWEWCDHAYYAGNKKDFYFGGDGNEWLHDGNFCADGMLRADRDLTSAAYEIANVYRPFYSVLSGNELSITSRLSFTGSEKYEIECKVNKDGKTAEVALDHDIKPLETQKFNLSENLCGENVLVDLTYKRNGKTCGSEQHVVKRTLPAISQKQGGEIKVTETEKYYVFDCGNVKYYFSKHTATFEKIEKNGKNYLSDKKSLLYNPYAAVNAFIPNIYRYKMDNDIRTLKEELNLHVYVTNDANAAALGEYHFGAGKKYKSLVMLTLGTGVGSGIVFNGKLFEGNLGAGVELGHEVIRIGGEKCTCGRKGCLEAYASATALIKQAQKAMDGDKESLLWKLTDGNKENVNGKIVFDALREGDKTAEKVVKKYTEYLAAGVTNVINAFHPQAIVLGGGICAAGDVFLTPLKRKVNRQIYGGTKFAPVEIVVASLGNDAGIYGAAALAFNKD